MSASSSRRVGAVGRRLLRAGYPARELPGQVGFHDRRSDVAGAADGGRVAQCFGDLLDRVPERRADLGPRRPATRAERAEREHRPGPRPEVLGRDLCPGGLTEVVVDVGRLDRARLAVAVEVLEQLLAGEVLAALDDPGDAPVAHADRVELAALAAKSKAQPGSRRRSRAGCAGWSGRTTGSSGRTPRCRPAGTSSRAGGRPSRGPAPVAGRGDEGRDPPAGGWPAGPVRTPRRGRT